LAATRATTRAWRWGAALGAAATAGRDKLVLADDGTGISGLGDWAEQLVAESTGKGGSGILPVVVETPTAPGATGDDVLTVTLGGALPPADMPGRGVNPHVAVNGPLGAQFLVWETATALAGRLLRINPFDQPNVTESKENTNKILTEGLPAQKPTFTDGAVEGYGSPASTVEGALAWLLEGIDHHGYLAILAYLDRFRPGTAGATAAPAGQGVWTAVTFGWGPRYLHSTGQYHKGGPQVGSFLEVTGGRDRRPRGSGQAVHIRAAAGRPGRR